MTPAETRDAEKMSHSIIGMESSTGESLQGCPDSRFPISLRASASLREISTAWTNIPLSQNQTPLKPSRQTRFAPVIWSGTGQAIGMVITCLSTRVLLTTPLIE